LYIFDFGILFGRQVLQEDADLIQPLFDALK
jgi:hypothetical protein